VSKRVLVCCLLLAGIVSGQSTPTPPSQKKTPETPHLRFVQEYVREINEDEVLQASSDKELGEAKTPNDQFLASIHAGKARQAALRSRIVGLKRMRLNDPFDTLIPTLIASYERQIELYQQMIDISGKFVAGPQAGVDYQALVSKLAGISAEFEVARKVTSEAAAKVFVTLIDQKPDSHGHASHLIITKAQKSALQDRLNLVLKDKSENAGEDQYAGAAMVLSAGLQKGFKCADEPWD